MNTSGIHKNTYIRLLANESKLLLSSLSWLQDFHCPIPAFLSLSLSLFRPRESLSSFIFDLSISHTFPYPVSLTAFTVTEARPLLLLYFFFFLHIQKEREKKNMGMRGKKHISGFGSDWYRRVTYTRASVQR